MSSNGMISPSVSLSDLRGGQAIDKLKKSTIAGKDTAAGKEKIQKSAREFEAVLLSHWLEQAEQSFATVPGGDKEEEDPGHDQFTAMAMQSVATSLSGSRGGLGIAAMVAKHLQATQSKGSSEDGDSSAKPLILKDLHPIPVSVAPLATPEGTK
jgi:Rod binding domain-containing protein